MSRITLHHPPSGLVRWDASHGDWLATPDALWQVTPHARVLPVEHVTALAVAAEGAVALSAGERIRLGMPPHPLRRVGLHATAIWQPGWYVHGLNLPYGARWASDLQPLINGLGATWTTDGQAFVATATGVRAVRHVVEQWHVSKPADDVDEVATATDGSLIWGPGGRLWDLANHWSAPLVGWPDGVAAAEAGRCVVVDTLTGEGRWFHRDRAESRFAIPLRSDAVDHVQLDAAVATVTTAMGKQFRVEQSVVQRVPGRHIAERAQAEWCDELGIAVAGRTVIADKHVAWRRDGSLFSWPRR